MASDLNHVSAKTGEDHAAPADDKLFLATGQLVLVWLRYRANVYKRNLCL